ncbi:MAG TPA: ferredoxin family protein, partial [Anaerolineae bacterium]|nr:ferredoxin family protein [Anaerolineae bacterium]
MQGGKHLGIPRELIPWYPLVDQDRCDGCGVCVTACKHGVLALDRQKAVVANPYECVVYCQSCEFQCDADAISHPNKESVKAV